MDQDPESALPLVASIPRGLAMKLKFLMVDSVLPKHRGVEGNVLFSHVFHA